MHVIYTLNIASNNDPRNQILRNKMNQRLWIISDFGLKSDYYVIIFDAQMCFDLIAYFASKRETSSLN